MANKSKEYSGKDIKVLSDKQHVRQRTQIYLGNTTLTSYAIPLFIDGEFKVKDVEFVPAVYKAVGEILDNCIDEFAQTSKVGAVLNIDAQPILGQYTVTDNGRGIPIDKHETGLYTPEVALGSLRSGRNFEDENQAGVIGQNGVGSACTNFCSVEFNIDIHRDGKRYQQRFSNGAEEVSKPSIRKGSAKTGTSISFQLDGEVFTDPGLPDALMHNRAIEIALTNPGVTTTYNNHKYKFKKGLEDFIKTISNQYHRFEYTFNNQQMEFFVILDVNDSVDEDVFTWVNSSLLFDGGICNTQFLNAFYDRTIKHLERDAKKLKTVTTKNDVQAKLMVLGSLMVSNPEYDAQSKTRLTGPNLRKEMGDMLDVTWSSFARKNKSWLSEVLDRAVSRHHASANKSALKDHKKKSAKNVQGLIDATGKDRMACSLLVTEGDSAASMITDARNPPTQGSLPLSGKINNVWGASVAQLLTMGKLTDLLTAIGLEPGKKAIRSELRYGRVIIATDADYDGADIFTLLCNLFFLWPELFDPKYPPFIHRLIAPNICAVKGKTRTHFPTRDEYEKVKTKYKNHTIHYYKGLGSMCGDDWEMVLNDTRCLLPIIDDGEMSEVLKLLFGPSADDRKGWLQNDE